MKHQKPHECSIELVRKPVKAVIVVAVDGSKIIYAVRVNGITVITARTEYTAKRYALALMSAFRICDCAYSSNINDSVNNGGSK